MSADFERSSWAGDAGPFILFPELLDHLGLEVADDCELCDAHAAAWTYLLEPFRMPPSSLLLLTDFGACEECKTLIEAGRWETIIGRWEHDSPHRHLIEHYLLQMRGAPTRREEHIL